MAIKDWRKEGLNVGDKLYMVCNYYWGFREPEIKEVYISHIGKTVLHVKFNLDDKYPYKFSKCKSTMNDFGSYYELYKTKEEYLEEVEEKKFKEKLCEDISENLKSLSKEQLLNIKQMMDKYL